MFYDEKIFYFRIWIIVEPKKKKMKKITKLLLVFILVLSTVKTFAGTFSASNSLSHFPAIKADMYKGGFFFNVGAFEPLKNYFNPPDINYQSGDEKFRLGEGFELGNMFKIVNIDPFAFGIRATWLNANYTSIKYQTTGVNIADTTVTDKIVHGNALKVGPYFTFGLSERIAIDLYYQIAPQYSLYLSSDLTGYSYLGLAHSVGADFRFSILSVGCDINFGTAKNIEFKDDIVRLPNMRLYVGLKL